MPNRPWPAIRQWTTWTGSSRRGGSGLVPRDLFLRMRGGLDYDHGVDRYHGIAGELGRGLVTR
jgi:hypothetical protein